jgi:hypothetical protein
VDNAPEPATVEPARAEPASVAERTARIRRGTARLCLLLGWSPLHEVALPNGRRADILALQPNGDFTAIEIKSGARDFLADHKWPEYRDWCDALCFAVDPDFPQHLLPDQAGLIVAAPDGACLLRAPPPHRLPPPRRRLLTRDFARLAAARLAALEDPQGLADLRHALRAE